MDADGLDEIQMVLRFEDQTVAKKLSDSISNGTIDRFSLEFVDDRCGMMFVDDIQIPCKLVDLPCVTECYKTLDGRSHYKTGNISQILYVGNDAKNMSIAYPDGMTPPSQHIRTYWEYRDKNDNIPAADIDQLRDAFTKIIETENEDITLESLFVPRSATDEDILSGKFSKPALNLSRSISGGSARSVAGNVLESSSTNSLRVPSSCQGAIQTNKVTVASNLPVYKYSTDCQLKQDVLVSSKGLFNMAERNNHAQFEHVQDMQDPLTKIPFLRTVRGISTSSQQQPFIQRNRYPLLVMPPISEIEQLQTQLSMYEQQIKSLHNVTHKARLAGKINQIKQKLQMFNLP